MTFTQAEMVLIAGALGVAREVYLKDATQALSEGMAQIAEQFSKQAKDAHELAVRVFDAI